ncbi:hypothetical protein E4U43_006284 [Claviceps pusilla]|uniref:Uncharacterized protein n=1 Tax=Claviceps pusilla TaxID=123648 RepID=A0A9P7NET7_9HYPO|nr:hypothetical protein E4U43_006284 [Claviceps pusilla]
MSCLGLQVTLLQVPAKLQAEIPLQIHQEPMFTRVNIARLHNTPSIVRQNLTLGPGREGDL